MRLAHWRGGLAPATAFASVVVCAANLAGSAPAELPAPVTAVECHIEATNADGFLELRAIGHSAGPAAGRYEFSISKRNAGGSTENRQSGDFALAPGQDRVLATVMLEAAAEGHYTAQLLLNWNGGSTSCHAP